MTNATENKLSLDFCKFDNECPLSLWERARVRVFLARTCLSCLCVFTKPSPPAPLPKGEGRNLKKSSYHRLSSATPTAHNTAPKPFRSEKCEANKNTDSNITTGAFDASMAEA